MDDEELLIRCDSLLSLIRHREAGGLTALTIHDLDELLPKLRARTDEITRARPARPRPRIRQRPRSSRALGAGILYALYGLAWWWLYP